jgi:ribose transport system ATP-binding protein
LGKERLPVSFIHQDLGLFDWMTVAENIALVRGYARRAGLIDWARIEAEAAAALEIVGSGISPDTPISDLSRTERSIVAIARALAVETDVLVLDEPTASLPQSDVMRLFDVLTRLRARGVGMIYVTHRLDEVFRIADRVTILRDGHKVGSFAVNEVRASDLVLHIVGRPPSKLFVRPPSPAATTVLEADEVRSGSVGPVSFRVMAGEILGLCGLRGAGQNVLGRAVCGIAPLSGGSLRLAGRALAPHGPAEAIAQGVAFVSSKREEESLATSLTVKENLFLNPAMRGRRLLEPLLRRKEARRAAALVDDFSIRPGDPDRVVSTLSGGNQQKVVLARWLGIDRKLLVLEEPTLGVDVGAKAEIYTMLNDSLKHGHAVILVSSDLDEVAGVCNRALIFSRGRIVGELQRDEMSVARLTALVGGADHGSASALAGIRS